MRKVLSIIGVFGLLLFVAASAQAAVEYSVTYMGNFTPTAINNKGDVAGWTISADTTVYHVALWQHAQLQDLGTLAGTYAIPHSINDSDQIVGVSESADGPLHAFLYDNGEMKDLGAFGGVSGSAYGINNSGQIAANYDTADGKTHAILYDHGAITELGSLGGTVTVAKAINSSGVIAGQGVTSQGERHSLVYNAGRPC